MLVAAITIIMLIMLIALVRAFKGPTLYDRILAVNLLGTKTVLLMATLAFVYERHFFLDIAMIYALLNFISIVGVLRYFEHRESTEIKRNDYD
ncbi:monovalent cation/H+ antiporter complex subunit F [Thalassotalea fusca]